MAAAVEDADLVHSHTWYANLGGHLAKLLHGIPHVATVHSLEPMRPWKSEQLGGGYALSSFCERTALEAADAIIAVSAGQRARHPRRAIRRRPGADRGDPQRHRRRRVPAGSRHRRARALTGSTRTLPSVVFVGRITRQKGVPHLLEAALDIDPAAQLVLCAGAPDTPEIAAEIAARVDGAARRARQRDLDRGDAAQARGDPDAQPCDRVRLPVDLRAAGHRQPRGDGLRGGRRRDGHAAAFPRSSRTASPVCSSRSRTRDDGSGDPLDPRPSSTASPSESNALLADPARASEMGRAGRVRAVEQFAWAAIGERTAALYRSLTE